MTADRALELAHRGARTAAPNPLVGCVIARNGTVVAEGWHIAPGQAHAEAMALASVLELKRAGYKPKRTIVVEFSGDEETTMRTSAVIAEKLNNAQLVLNIDGQLWSVVEFQHVKPGKGPAFVRTKLKHVLRYLSGTRDYFLELKPKVHLHEENTNLTVTCHNY